MEKQSVSVKIYNESYVLRTSASQEQVLQVAHEVDRRMNELAEKKNIQGTGKVAVWTALDLAAELFELQQRYDRLLAAIRER